jgi:hypothetical protein
MSTTPPIVADVPGRGSWRRTGGLLPAKPGGPGSTGFYREAQGTETPIGSRWVRKTDESHTAHVVNLGVRAIQLLVGLSYSSADGWFGPKTADQVLRAQARVGVKTDGIVGPATMRALLLPILTETAEVWSVPLPVLGGLAVFESGLDPAAVGTNGYDTGLAQINLAVHVNIGLEQALNHTYALSWAASNIRGAYERFEGRTTADLWDVAIAWHNSPVAATLWARHGEPQHDPDRSIQIADYVAKVKAAW